MCRMDLVAVLLVALALPAGTQPVVRNGSFEADGTQIRGVGYVWQGNPISHWVPEGGKMAARNAAGQPFHDNGAIPDGAAFAVLQNRSGLSQRVVGFAPDTVYRLRLRANGRAADAASCGGFGVLQVMLNGTTLLDTGEVKPVDVPGSFNLPFHEYAVLFTTGGGGLTLRLDQISDRPGVSVFVDDVRIEPVDDIPDRVPAVAVNRAAPRSPTERLTEAEFRDSSWIWSVEKGDSAVAVPAGTRCFRRRFELPTDGKIGRAFIVATADNAATFFVNGLECGRVPGFSSFYDMDVTARLRPGPNVLAVRAENAGEEPNPAAFAALLVVVSPRGETAFTLPTDGRWRASGVEPDAPWTTLAYEDGAWASAQVVGPLGIAPWHEVGFLLYDVPNDFSEFRVPGFEEEMGLLRQLHYLHYRRGGPLATIWDLWMSQSTLWQAVDSDPGGEDMRQRWRQALHGRRIDAEGYVSTHQHHGFGHGEGWPFPTSQQARGVAWQFAPAHAFGNVGQADPAKWQVTGMTQEGLDETTGWTLRITDKQASLLSPEFAADHAVAPFIRLEWACQGFRQGDQAWLDWRTGEGAWHSMAFTARLPGPGWRFTDIPVYRSEGWGGTLRQLRFRFPNAVGTVLKVQGVCTAVDTRQQVNNACYLQGCTEYYRWTGDKAFLADEIQRMSRALAFALDEFGVREKGCVSVPWIGHDGRSGFDVDAAGHKTIHYGRGIGGNYWDLLPFGGRDFLATVYLADAVRRLADLARPPTNASERTRLPVPMPENLAPADLDALQERMIETSRRLFWNPQSGRFVAGIDSDGVKHDYGYTFLNTEAVTYGLASPAQARSVMDWLGGRRVVAGDTSVGDDIYHFRFGPRASTRRNVEWYTFVWSNPEGIPWGGQVQDGGAVLGFSYYDLMARLLTNGPDDAWAQLREVIRWFGEVRAAGGYREYYRDPARGTLQGGGTAGGLGLDCEFFESILVPQVMIYGFLGFRPLAHALELYPRLPSDWPELTVTRIRYRDVVLDVTAMPAELLLHCRQGVAMPAVLRLPSEWRTGEQLGAARPSAAGGALRAHEVTFRPGETVRFRR